MTTILVTGASGSLGSFICNHFIDHGYDVTAISRHSVAENLSRSGEKKINNIVFDYNKKNQDINIDDHINKYDALIHCGYNFLDKTIENSENVVAIKNLLMLKDKLCIPLFFNISTLSSFKNAVSGYGKTKYYIEQIVTNSAGINIRLGILDQNPPVGILKMITKLSGLFPLFAVALDGGSKSSQYITQTEKFCQFLIHWIENKNPTSGTFSFVEDKAVYLVGLTQTISGKTVLKIHWRIVYALLFIIEFLGLKLRFGTDSILGLVNSIESPENNICE